MSSFAAGMIYVMLSRVQCIDQLQIINEFDPEKIKVDESVKAETARMWEVSCNKNPTAWMNSEESGFRVSSLNCRSLRKHIQDVKTDDLLLQADVIALQETWLEKGEDEQGPYQLEGYRAIFASAGRGKGLVTYVKGDIHLIQTVRTDDLQICKITMENADVINIYRSQEEPLSRVKDVLLPLIEPEKETILVGDFNFCATEKNQLSDALEKAGLIQLVSMPTHIQGGNKEEISSPVKLYFIFHLRCPRPYLSSTRRQPEGVCCMRHSSSILLRPFRR